MRFATTLAVGPARFRIGSDWRAPIEQLDELYRAYPQDGGIVDFTVTLTARSPLRRRIRPAVVIGGDYTIPDAAPLPLAQGLLAAEMGMNLQMALGQRRFLLLHAAAVERDGSALLLTGQSGAGKSTLAALLMAAGWRLMGDEFALIDPATGLVHPFPRLVSLKNEAIEVVWAKIPGARFGPLMAGTPKGDIRHLVPDRAAIAAMHEPALPALILFPAFGYDAETRDVTPAEAFIRLTQASTNYAALGERGFVGLTTLIRAAPAYAVDYPDAAAALSQVEALWRAI